MTDDPSENLKRTPLDSLHRELGGRMVPFAGYEMPVQYEGILAEHLHTRRQAALFDVSHMGQARLWGPDADAAFETLVPGDVVELPRGRIRYAQRVVTCPGKRLAPDSNIEENKIAFVDGPDANIRLSLLMLDRIALAGVSGEVLTPIGDRLKQTSPLSRTLMVTHTNGATGYIANDAAYQQVSYEIWSSPLKAGCAERTIVESFEQMIKQNR